MFPFFLPYFNKFWTSIFISLVLYAFLMLLIAPREFQKVVAFGIFESITNCMSLRIAYDFAVKIELVLGSLYISCLLFQITEAPTPN